MSDPASTTPPEKSDTLSVLPDWCDLGCPWAEFPKKDALDGAQSCRTFLAIHCRYLNRLVTKNSRCMARKKNPDPVSRQSR